MLSLLLIPFLWCGCSSSDDSASPAKNQLKIMSFNIRYSNTIDLGDFAWDARKEPCMKMIREENPDLIGFQEPRQDQLEYITSQLTDYHFTYQNMNEGSTTAATYNILGFKKDKFEMIDGGHYWLSPTPEVRSKGWDAAQVRLTQWVKLKYKKDGSELCYFNTHMDHIGQEARVESAKLNIAKMKEIGGRFMPIFINGDMNASYYINDNRRAGVAPYFEWMWSAKENAPDSDEVLSYNDFGNNEPKPTWNIDYIFYRMVTPIQYRVIKSKDYGVEYLSDHYPITLTCEF